MECKKTQFLPTFCQNLPTLTGPDQGLAPESDQADNPGMLKIWLLAIPALLAGCADDDINTVAARKAHADKRQAKAEATLSKTPVPRTYSLQGNQLQVVEVPVADSSGFVDQQRCFVWRDQEFKSVTMSCGQQPDVLVSN